MEDIRKGVAEVRRTNGYFIPAEYGDELQKGQLYTSIIALPYTHNCESCNKPFTILQIVYDNNYLFGEEFDSSKYDFKTVVGPDGTASA